MRSKGARIFFVLLWLVYLATVSYLCFSTLQHIPHVSRYMWGFPTDKLVHFAMFLPFSILTYLAFAPDTRKFLVSFLAVVIIFVIGCGIAASTEYIQKFLPYRSADIMDFKADAKALALSSALVLFINLVAAIVRAVRKR